MSPVVAVVSMGKTGSNTAVETLQHHLRSGTPLLHLHSTNALAARRRAEAAERAGAVPSRPVRDAVRLSDLLADGNRPDLRIVSCVREPLGRHLSAAFQNIHRLLNGYRDHPGHGAAAVLLEREASYQDVLCHTDAASVLDLLRSLWRDFHDVDGWEWVGQHLERPFAVTVRNRPFPKGLGFGRYEADNDGPRAVIIRLEDMSRHLPDAVRWLCDDVLDQDVDIDIVNANRSGEKAYVGLYQFARRHLGPSDDLIGQYLETDFVHHFWTEAERADMWARWRATRDTL